MLLKKPTKGAGLVEYAIVVGLVSVVAISSVYQLGNRVSDTYDTARGAMADKMNKGSSEAGSQAAEEEEEEEEGAGAPSISEQCYAPENLDTVGAYPGCDGMLIVNSSLLRSAASTFIGGDGTFSIHRNGTDYTFADSEHNLFTGQVTDMTELFLNEHDFNDDISYWDTSNVITMKGMFWNAQSFTADIGLWNTSKVEDMSHSFTGAKSFNSFIGNWDVSSVRTFSGAFSETDTFDQDLSEWDTSNADSFRLMFVRAKAFSADIGNWDVTSIPQAYDIYGMFHGAESFASDLSGWCVENIDTPDAFATGGSGIESLPEYHPKWGNPC